jgi:electron transfer flavoprotein alpha subunit
MSGSIWVLVEQWRGRVSEVTYETLALGREVADALGVPLVAVLLGSHAKDLAQSLGKADQVLYVDHPLLAETIPQTHADALVQLVRERKPRACIVPLTNVSLGVGTLMGAQLGAPAVNFCKDLRVVDGALEVDCVLYGGKIEARVAAAGEPVILGVWPGVRPADKGRADQAPPVEEVSVVLGGAQAVRLKRYLEPEAGDVDLTQQDVLVAAGRGIQSKENIALVEELAKALGGVVCGSRPVIDQGWLPLSRQVGKSGLTVKPRLYIALGISGAPEHVEGMKDSALIVAVNSDPHAPIFGTAHYGIVADAVETIPVLTAAIAARKSASRHD